MAIGVVPNVGEQALLDLWKQRWNTLLPVRIHLYRTDVTPDPDSVVGDFVEANFPGYAAHDLDSWAGPDQQPDGSQLIVNAEQVWTYLGTGISNEIYGYYVTDDTDSVLYWAEKDGNGPQLLFQAGEEYRLIPRLYLQSRSDVVP